MDTVYPIADIKKKLHPVFDAAPIYCAILFGSYAKGVATHNSDIDVVIDSRGEIRGLDFYGILEDMVVTLGKDVDLFEVSEIRKDSPIYNEVFEQGVVLYER